MTEIPSDPLASSPTTSQPHDSALIRWLMLLIPAVAIFTLDQVSKAWMLNNLVMGQSIRPIEWLGDLLTFTLSANTGAAFSMLPQLADIFLLIALAMIVGIVVFYRRMPAGYRLDRIALGLLLGGVCGNALDRLRHGFVVDFFHITIPSVISNVSNFADHAIVVGIIVLFILQWRRDE
ncbi:MAG: signal peptidase II [Anaerolineae bacterium]|nr:signal peptidase II [Anaerolineae bacterium]